MKLKYLKILRPEQWYKNLVVFIIPVVAAQLFNPQVWINSAITFASFCLLSGSGYIINDLKDIGKDKIHPTKRHRPIAAGLISKRNAIIMASILATIGLTNLGFINTRTLLIGSAYLALTITYTYALKPHYYPGLIAISSGFVLRAVGGCTALGLPPSIWLLSCVFILALILTTAKRGKHEGLTELSIALLFVYALYTFQRLIMIPTVIPAGYIIHRYLKLKPEEQNPELILKDKRLQAAVVTWITMVGLILHFGGT